jgi:hypothetical protein
VSIYRRTRPKDPKDPVSRRVPYGRWYIRIADHMSIDRRLPAYPSKSASVELEAKLRRLVELRRERRAPEGELATFFQALPPHLLRRLVSWDLLNLKRASAGRPLADLLADFEAHLEAKARTGKHVEHAVSRAARLFAVAGFERWSDINAGAVARALQALREGEHDAIEKYVLAYGHKAAKGDETSKRTERYRRELRDEGMSAKTSNHLLASARAFTRWIVRQGLATKTRSPSSTRSTPSSTGAGCGGSSPRRSSATSSPRRSPAPSAWASLAVRGCSLTSWP